MIYASKNCIGKNPDNTVISLFSSDWKRVCEVEMSAEQIELLKRKKKHITIVSWMQVVAQSDDKQKLGIYATEVNSPKEL